MPINTPINQPSLEAYSIENRIRGREVARQGEEEEEKEEEADAEAEEGCPETSLQDVSPDLCEPNCPTISFHKK